MTTSDVKVTPGSGKNVATFSITEDAETKEIQRIAQCDSSGNEIEAVVVGQDVAAASLPVVLASDDPAVTSLAIMDDWDESDRAKVNIIAGQAGVAANAGAAGATVIRTVTASDSPDVATLGATTGSAVTTDANGTLQQYLRGIVKQGINLVAGEYETVAASQTTQALGATGAAGDYLEGVLIVPATVDAGAVSIKDGSNSAITIFTGGTASLVTLVPFYVPLGMVSVQGAWQITTGASVSAIGIGNFT